MRQVKIDDIRIDGGTQCRVVLSQPKIYEYRERMEEGDEFPPIEATFDGATYWLTDGFHRWHAMKLMGLKEVTVKWKPGTLEDAVIAALKANSKHGIPLTNEDKRKKVLVALELPGWDQKSNYEIAKACDVSQPFVAAVRDPEAKKRQDDARQRSAAKKAEKTQKTEKVATNQISNPQDPHAGEVPDEAEMRATELAHEADVETLHKLLEADEPLKVAHEEIQRLNHLNAQLEVRLNGLMAEKNEAVKMVKSLQKQLDKLKKEK